jgi:hypothetical protein
MGAWKRSWRFMGEYVVHEGEMRTKVKYQPVLSKKTKRSYKFNEKSDGLRREGTNLPMGCSMCAMKSQKADDLRIAGSNLLIGYSIREETFPTSILFSNDDP